MTIDRKNTGNLDELLCILAKDLPQVIMPKGKRGWQIRRNETWQHVASAIDCNHELATLTASLTDPYWNWAKHALATQWGMQQFMSRYRTCWHTGTFDPRHIEASAQWKKEFWATAAP